MFGAICTLVGIYAPHTWIIPMADFNSVMDKHVDKSVKITTHSGMPLVFKNGYRKGRLKTFGVNRIN